MCSDSLNHTVKVMALTATTAPQSKSIVKESLDMGAATSDCESAFSLTKHYIHASR